MTCQADEQRRRWKHCVCPIYASGTLGKVFKRKNTERTTWDEANALARAWEARIPGRRGQRASVPGPGPHQGTRYTG